MAGKDGIICWHTSRGLQKEGSSFQSSNAHSDNLNTYVFLGTLGNFTWILPLQALQAKTTEDLCAFYLDIIIKF